MKLFLKIVGYACAGVVGLVIVAFIALQLISDEQYKKWLTGAAEAATGRTLAIDGDFNVQIGSTLGLAARDVRFANVDWGSREEMVTADRLLVQLKVFPLFKGVVDVTVEIDSPDILLETDGEGGGNWVFAAGEPGQETPGAEQEPAPAGEEGSFSLPVKPYIRNFQISDLVFVYADGPTAKRMEATVDTFRLFVDGNDIPLTLVGTYQGAPVELGGSLGDVEQWYANEPTPISLQGSLNTADLLVEGSAGPMLPSPSAQLEMSVKAADIESFEPFAGADLPALQGLDIALNFSAADGQLAADKVALNLNDPRLLVAVQGAVANLAGVSGIDLRAEITSEQATELLSGLDLPGNYSLPETIRVKADVSGSLEQLAISDLELLIRDSGLDISLTGAVENVLGSGSGSADLALALESSSLIGTYIGQEIPSFGPLSATAQLSSADKVLQLESLQIDLQDPALNVEIDGSARKIGRSELDTFEMSGIQLSATAATQQIGEIFNRLGVEIPTELPSRFNLAVQSEGSLDKLGITELLATVTDPGVEVKLSGTVDNVIDQSGIVARLTGAVDDTAALSRFAGIEIPALGSLTLDSNLSSAEDTYRLEDLALSLDGELVQAQVEAAIADLMALTEVGESNEAYARAGIEVSVEMQTAALDEMGKLAGVQTIPDLGTLTVDGELGSSDTSLSLENLDLALSGETLEASIKAIVADLMVLANVAEDRKAFGAAGLDVALEATTASVARLAGQAGMDLPEIGSLALEGHLGSSEESLTLDTLIASLTKDGLETRADLVIEDVLKLRGIKAVVDGNLDSLSTLSELAQAELPETGPWVLQIKADTENPESPVTIAAQLEGEGTTTVLDAVLPDPLAPQTFETQLAVDIESLARVGALLDKEIPEDKSMQISGEASGTPGEYLLEQLRVRAAEGELLANLAYRTPPAGNVERTSLTGELTFTDFDFTDFLAAKEETAEAEAEESAEGEETAEGGPESVQDDLEAAEEEVEALESEVVAEQQAEEPHTEESPASGKRLFSDQPLAVGALRDYDVDLKINATNIRIPNGIDMDAAIAVNLDDGLLRIDPIDLDQTNGGSGNGYLMLDARGEEAVLDAAVDFDDFVSPRFGGLFNLDIDLDGKGESLAELMGSLNGYFATALKDVELEKSFMSQFGAGLLSNLNPLDSDKTLLECAVVRFDIEDGLADFNKKIAAQTTEVTWMGGGEIDLKTEELDVGIAPQARGAISGLTNVGLASLVHIGGTLAEPKIGIDLADVAKKYASYTAFFATGGLSFLAQKMVGTVQANVDQCERILGDLQAAADEEAETESSN